jgi:hypothetical protein
MHNHPDRRQALATLASPAHTRERSAGTFAAVLDCGALCWRGSVSPNAVTIFCPRVGMLAARFTRITYLSPSPIPLLNNLRNRPSFRRSFAHEDVLDHHGGGESGGDVEDFEVAVRVLASCVIASFTAASNPVQITSASGKGSKCTGRKKNLQRLPLMLILPNLARLVENLQLGVLGGEHVVCVDTHLWWFVRVCWNLCR